MDDIAHDAPASRRSPSPPCASPRATAPGMPPSATASSSGVVPASASHALRRAVTIGDAAPFRRRLTSMTSLLSSDAGDVSTQRLRRRSSTLSDFSMTDAPRSFRDGTQDIFSPSAAKHVVSAQDSSSILTMLPLAFALLPALFGVLFQGGAALITDVMLLGLVFIILRYTITQPWQWYHEAQEVRIKEEVGLEHYSDDGSENDVPAKMNASMATLDEVPEEDVPDEEDEADHKSHRGERQHVESETRQRGEKNNRTQSQQAAVNELYVHEVLALLACFLSPVLGAYLLHAIRSQLTRPSEGLMTDFNITVFLLAAEVRPLSHALKLIQARTLHLQRIVQSVPIAKSTVLQLEDMRIRLAQLEMRAAATEEATATALASATQANAAQQEQQSGATSNGKKDATVREVRNAIQPDIDAVTRAVRRYEKKVTIMSVQTAAQLNTMDTRLDDAIALAAAAAKQHNQARWGFVSLATSLLDWLVAIITMPYHFAMFIIMWPFRTIGRMCFQGRKSRQEARQSSGRSGRLSGFRGSKNGSGSDKDRYRDRVPSRMSGRFSP